MPANQKRLTLTSLRQGTTDVRVVETYYDDLADNYDAKQAFWEYRAPEDAVDLLAPCLEPGARVLDVGCGTGLLGRTLRARIDVALDGIDISSASLKHAEGCGLYGRLMKHDLQQPPLPVPDKSYDAAMSVGVLTYIPDAEALLRDLCRAVKGGGVIAFSQRSDLWQERDFDRLVEQLELKDLWRPQHVSAPVPYLPGHEEFADEIRVIHAVCRVV